MALASGGELAAAWASAGALGLVGGGYGDLAWTKDIALELRYVRKVPSHGRSCGDTGSLNEGQLGPFPCPKGTYRAVQRGSRRVGSKGLGERSSASHGGTLRGDVTESLHQQTRLCSLDFRQ
jgi:hypothetical protein